MSKPYKATIYVIQAEDNVQVLDQNIFRFYLIALFWVWLVLIQHNDLTSAGIINLKPEITKL